MIDPNLVDTSFRVLKTTRAASGFVREFERTATRYFVIADTLDPGSEVMLVDRQTFIADLVDAAFDDAGERRRWRDQLTATPDTLSAFIADNVLNLEMDSDVRRGIAAGRMPRAIQQRVSRVVSGYLRDPARAARHRAMVVDGTTTAPEQWDARAVVSASDGVVGVFEETMLDVSDWRGSRNQRPVANAAPRETPAKAFKAHPRIEAEGAVVRARPLGVLVGFSDRPDADADEQKRIIIEDAEPGETLLVIVSAEGATIDDPNFAELPLDLSAEHRFSAQVAAGADHVVLRAKYLFRNKLIGGIVKTLASLDADDRTAGATAGRPGGRVDALVPVNPWPFPEPSALAGIDLLLLVENEEAGWVSWTAVRTAPRSVHGPIRAKLGEATAFARRLAGIRGTYGDTGAAAHEELNVTGARIAESIPKAVLDVLLPLLQAEIPPTVLLMTDQPFVPWELARLAPLKIGRSRPAFLGELARIGRWWTGSTTPTPQSSRTIERVSAVAASQYGLGTNRQQLPEAREERKWLHERYGAGTIEAVKEDVNNWLDRAPRPSGHLGHIALHGYSDAVAGAQGLVLGDGHILTPGRLAGEYYEGETPRFEMLFLNACQVGTAGEELGRIAGFPGALLSGGAAGFIGPLWEVHDGVARKVAEEFYTRLFAGNEEVGEALRAMRAVHASQGVDGSITPWAYLFYGHPCLRLRLAPTP